MKTSQQIFRNVEEAYANLHSFKQIKANNELELLNKTNGVLFYTNQIKELAFSYIAQLNLEGDFSIEFSEELLKFQAVN